MDDIDRDRLAGRMIAACLALLLLAACSDRANDGDVTAPASAAGSSGMAGSGTADRAGAGGAGAMAGAGRQSVAPAPGSGSIAGSGTVGGADAGGTGGQTGQPGTDAGAGETADCTPVSWEDPGVVPNPMVEAVPADAGMGKPFDQSAGMDEYDYVMEEFLFSGASPAYTSRMVVRRPRDPAKFSGTVFAEWYNVSGGIDFAVLWANSREYFMRAGHVFVGVSAQQVGATALKDFDAERYARLTHPGDTAADAIFSQAGVALHLQSVKLFGPCMPVHAVLAVGQSQSSFRLAQYVDGTHPKDKVYDGFMLHSGLEPRSNDPGTPTFVVFTMSEGNGSLEDGPNLVEWMVAGATHNDKRVTSRGAELGTSIGVSSIMCRNPLNEFPSYRAYSAALDWLHRWVRNDERPPAGMPFQMSGNQLAVDALGNGLGGVRLPDIEAPIATYGLDNGPTDPFDFVGALACGLGGETVPLTDAQLLMLYPTHEDYVKKYTDAADKALAAGYLLQADYDEAIAQAQAATVP
jgi:hypothetical protein